LPIHLENNHNIIFLETAELSKDELLNRETMLTAWFKLNQNDEQARQFLYCQIPEHYIYYKMQWIKRRNKVNIITRMYTVSPKDTERFHLRILLQNIRGKSNE